MSSVVVSMESSKVFEDKYWAWSKMNSSPGSIRLSPARAYGIGANYIYRLVPNGFLDELKADHFPFALA